MHVTGRRSRRSMLIMTAVFVGTVFLYLGWGCIFGASSVFAESAGITPESNSAVLAAGAPSASDYDPHKQAGHEHGASSDSEGLTVKQLVFYTARVLYYAAMLIAAGIMLWFSGIKRDNAVQRGLLNKWGLLAVRCLLIAVLLHVFVQANRLMENQSGGGAEWLRLFTETNIGRSWLAIIALALLGFMALKLPDPAKGVWALLVAAVESWNGHSLASPYASVSVLLDFVHLVCAALWSGGLTLLLLLWKADRKEAGRFAESFSRTAVLSLAALIVTGIGSAATLLPGWSSLLYTGWGRLLAVKSLLVLAVLAVGMLLRSRVRRRQLPKGSLLAADFTLMAAITIIAALFTYMTPVPSGEPLAYHKMGDTVHITLNITPNAVGLNTAVVKVWLPEESGEPEQVKLLLHGMKEREGQYLDVPLVPYEDTSYESFEGFTRWSYRAESLNLADPDDWVAELRITGGSGEEQSVQIPFRNYGG